MVRGRFAPSPTGLLHLGNAWSFWIAWLAARKADGEIILRMEDSDPDRSREEFSQAIVRDFSWLGLDWDAGYGRPDAAVPGPFAQSACQDIYAAALELLRGKGLVYPCFCTRKELRFLAGAPHMDDAGAPYPGTCRHRPAAERAHLEASGRQFAWRVFCPEDAVWTFDDRIQGPQRFSLPQCGGDFAVRRSDGVTAYQLAVVVDDVRMGVTQVVRGRDILPSVPRQMYLYACLAGAAPEYAHVPLVLDSAGERLAKRHQGLTIQSLREAGIRPETIWGCLALWSGITEAYAPLAAGDLLPSFAFGRIQGNDFCIPEDPVAAMLRFQGR